MIVDRIPATLELGTVALIISLLVGIPTGVYTALRPKGFLTQSVLMITLVGVSIPTFVIGIMLIFLFGVQLGWLPTFGRGGIVEIGGWTSSLFTIDGWRALILPALTLGVYQLTLTMRLVRAEMMEVLRSDYIRFARPSPTSARQIFLNRRVPFGPFTSSSVLRNRVRYLARRAGVKDPPGGTHCFRHSHASRQVELGISIKTLADILGHRDPETTSIYTRSAVQRLRRLALPLPR